MLMMFGPCGFLLQRKETHRDDFNRQTQSLTVRDLPTKRGFLCLVQQFIKSIE